MEIALFFCLIYSLQGKRKNVLNIIENERICQFCEIIQTSAWFVHVDRMSIDAFGSSKERRFLSICHIQ